MRRTYRKIEMCERSREKREKVGDTRKARERKR
jgi:hypothetical protein